MSLTCHPETAFGELKSEGHSFPLHAVDVEGRVKGLLYGATVTQSFHNDRDARMEAVYTFPLPPSAAVHNFTITIGERVIQGTVKERQQARQEYQEAISQGHRAALLEEERSDIFTTTVGNIGPGEDVVVRFEMSAPMSCHKNTARLRFPLVVGEVYIPGDSLAGESIGGGTACDTTDVPDASRITPPRLAPGAPNPVRLTLSFQVDTTQLDISKVESTCHFARVQELESVTTISLLPGMERLDRAFVLDVTYPKNKLQTCLQVDKESRAFALTVIPPVAKEAPAPRDLVIVLDRSSSMNGWPVIAARQAAARIIESLNHEDRFGLVAYDTDFLHLDPTEKLHPAKQFFKMRSSEFLNNIEAQGATDTEGALREAFRYLKPLAERDLHILLITNGHVGNDDTIMTMAQQGIRISTVGIGAASREGLLQRMATASGGLCTLIPNQADLEQELLKLHRNWGEPEWQNLSLTGVKAQTESPKYWDVWEHVPTTFFGILAKRGVSSPKALSGLLPDGETHKIKLKPHVADEPLIYRAWARAKLLDLEDQFVLGEVEAEDMVKLSVKSQVLCRFTAFSAVDRESKVEMDQALQEVVQPVERTQIPPTFQGFGGFNRASQAAMLQRSISEQDQARSIFAQIGAENMKCQMPRWSIGSELQTKIHELGEGIIDRDEVANIKWTLNREASLALSELLHSVEFKLEKLGTEELKQHLEVAQKMVELCGDMTRQHGLQEMLKTIIQLVLDYQSALESLFNGGGDDSKDVSACRSQLESSLQYYENVVCF